MNIQKFVLFSAIVLLISIAGYGLDSSSLPKDINYKFNVSMEQPGNHYFHVELTCNRRKPDFIDFKLPVWTPGYYKIQNFSKNVVNFKAMNAEGLPLSFIKTQTNTWRVNAKKEKTGKISYDV
jgi:predicted metalloprotease with PDZ domain